MMEHTGRGAGKVIRARGVIRIGRGGEQRQPRWIANGQWIEVVVAFPDGRNRPPEVIVLLAVPGSDCRSGHRHVGEGEEPGTVPHIVEMSRRQGLKGPVPVEKGVVGKEVSHVGLLWRSG